jgi:hypothetical protein
MDADSTHPVALFNPGETEHNTIILGGVDLLIPLEMDMDGDPFQDDAVCLRTRAGGWEDVKLSSDPDVRPAPDTRHLFYPFEDVPAGVYSVEVRIADTWTTVLSDIRVSRGAAWVGDRKLDGTLPAAAPGTDDPHSLIEREEPDHDHTTDCGCAH